MYVNLTLPHAYLSLHNHKIKIKSTNTVIITIIP